MLTRVVVLLLAGIWISIEAVSQAAVQPKESPAFPDADDLPISAEYHYRLSGSARPFLFWITRDDVGSGRLTWRRTRDGTQSLELLMGSDPERAPFNTNRWGYIREVVRGDSAELVAIKSGTEEETIDEVRAKANGRDGDRTLLFIRERITPHEARASTALVDVGDASYRELSLVLEEMSKVRDWEERVSARPRATRPGFLVALTELIQSGVDSWLAASGSSFKYGTRTLVYIHRAKPYELRQSDVEVLRDVTLGGRHYPRLLRGAFRLRNPSTGYQSHFVVTYGIEGALAGVPVRITFQPRWWLRTQLTLDTSASAAHTAPAVP